MSDLPDGLKTQILSVACDGDECEAVFHAEVVVKTTDSMDVKASYIVNYVKENEGWLVTSAENPLLADTFCPECKAKML